MENEPILHTINVVLTDCSCSYFFYVCNEIIHVLGSPVWIWPSFIFKKKKKKGKGSSTAADPVTALVGSCDLRRPTGISERASLVPSKSLTGEIWRSNLSTHLRDTDGEKYISADLGVWHSNTFWRRQAAEPPVGPAGWSWCTFDQTTDWFQTLTQVWITQVRTENLALLFFNSTK